MGSVCVIYFAVFIEVPFGIDALICRNVIQVLKKNKSPN